MRITLVQLTMTGPQEREKKHYTSQERDAEQNNGVEKKMIKMFVIQEIIFNRFITLTFFARDLSRT